MPINVLAVEDDPQVAKMVALALDGQNCNVTLAATAKDAVETIDKHPSDFDVVLTDNRMPGASGGQLVRHLSDCNFGGRVVVLSGYIGDDQKEEYEKLGVSAMLAKPFDLAELRRAVGLSS